MPRAAYVNGDARLREVWQLLAAHAGDTFVTAKGLPFTYTVRGGELFVDRRKKSITIATVAAALRRIDELLEKGEDISGPKKLDCYGASYLYPILLKLGFFARSTQQLGMQDLLL